MKKAWLVLLLLGAVPVIPIRAQEVKIDVLGVSVGRKLNEAQKSVFMFVNEGTRLQMSIAIPGRTFIGEARDECKFGKFTDDKGTNLFAPLGHAPEADDWLGTFGPKFTDDGKLCGLQIKAPGLPAKDATQLQFAGTLVLRCGMTPKTVEQKNVVLKKGAKITAGPVPFQILKVTPAGNETKFELKANRPLDRIIKVAFFDAGGKEIKSDIEGYESGSIFGNYEITQYYVLSRKIAANAAVTVKVSYFDKVENVTVPINVEADLGL
jgi:hypothetical protein